MLGCPEAEGLQSAGGEHPGDVIRCADNLGGVLGDVAHARDRHDRDDITGGVKDRGPYRVDSFNHFSVGDEIPLVLELIEVARIDSFPDAIQITPPRLSRQVR